MPKRTDVRKILVLGSGPIVIGQAAEFDYSGTQCCKALREEGFEVVLVNSNPATIMTDTDTAEAVYVEPLNWHTVEMIIEKEKPDGIIPTMGGQTGLNLAVELFKRGILAKHNVKVLGTSIESIQNGEDRDLFKALMNKIGEPIPKSAAAKTIDDAKEFVSVVGYPVIVRPAYTLGGHGSGVAFNETELETVVARGLKYSMIGQVLIEEAILGIHGWGEFELEVMRDSGDNCIIICPMENFDPMGYHTGESIVSAPIQTLNDNDFQTLRSSAIRVIRALRVEGGCNIQFAFNYETGEYRIIEVNPRVSRSSALASKATGYPIARIAAKIAIGMNLDEIPNAVTEETKACFEPTIDYVVVKIPRWPFDKFRTVDRHIGTQMKSTGETMAIGRTFEEAFQKAIRSLETGRAGLGFDGKDKPIKDKDELKGLLSDATHERIFHIKDAISLGMSIDEIHAITGINKWFLLKIKNIIDFASTIDHESQTKETLLRAKKLGFSDCQLAFLTGSSEDEVREARISHGIVPTYKMVDTCAAEFEAKTPYLYSSYETEDESNPTGRKKVLIIGGGPIRIGQGIEFDYCCIHSVYALREEKIEALIINNNPETVSTDFDTSDKLYFEPLTFEDVMNVIDREKPYGVIVQFGGQTPINMAMKLHEAGVNVLGTQPESIDIAEDRQRFGQVLEKLKIPSADYGTAFSVEEAIRIANQIGYPVLVRPSYVLGGRAMQIVDKDSELISYMEEAVLVSPDKPVLIDKFLSDAIELDVDALCDGREVYIAAIMEHIEEAGIHSGDSACVIPPQSISSEVKEKIIEYTKKLALEIGTVGLINIQYAVKEGTVYILEANPRASRTVPYVSKTIGIPLAKIATKIILGKRLSNFSLSGYKEPSFVTVKESVFPFIKLYGVDPVLSPEMKSTGEVMGIDKDYGKAFYKAQSSAYMELPKAGNILLSIGRDQNKQKFIPFAKEFVTMGFSIFGTEGTSKFFLEHGIKTEVVPKVSEDPKIIRMMREGSLNLIIIIPRGSRSGKDGYTIRRSAVELNLPYITTIAGAKAAIKAISSLVKGKIDVGSLQYYYGKRA